MSQRPLRIGYLTYGLDRAPTGIGRYAVELLRALAALPGAPEIVLLTTEREDPHGLWAQFERVALPGCRLLPGLMTAGNLAVMLAAQRCRLDLVHDANGVAPFFWPARGVRRVVTIHDAFAYVYPQAHNRLDTWRYRWMLPAAARRAGLVLTDSEHSRRDLLRFLRLAPARVQVVPLGVDARFAPIPDGEARRTVLARYGARPPYLLYVGGLNARKNLARLFAAFAGLRASRPDLMLLVAGKRQWATAEMDAAVRQFGLEEAVRFTGYVADTDLPALYSAAAAFVFPSLYEGFGLPPLEALACGTPVVCSNAASLPEAVGDAALLVDPYDVAGLAQAIARVLDDEALRVELRRRGLARAAQFRWAQTAQATLAAYRRLSPSAHPPESTLAQ